MRYCKDESWIDANSVMVLKPPKVSLRPTLPFDDGEMTRILAAADALEGWGSFGPKARAMVLLLRYSGVRMQDAACLERSWGHRRSVVPFHPEDRDAGVPGAAVMLS